MPLRRLGFAALALLTAGCAPGSATTPTTSDTFGFVVITAGGSALGDGARDVPTTLDLRILAGDGSGVAARLDGTPLDLHHDGRALTARVAPMPLASVHRLDLTIPGRVQPAISFHVVPAAAIHAAAHADSALGTVLDVAFALTPDHTAVEAALPPGGAPSWPDDRHLRASWAHPPNSPFHLTPQIAAARGSHLAAALDIALGAVPAGTVRSITVPAPDALPSHPLVVAFSVATAASRASVAAHAAQISVLSPTGITAGSDGALQGTPDAPAAETARVAGIALWPLVQALDTASVHSMLSNPAAIARLIGELRATAATSGYPGIHLDVENAAEEDRPALTSLITQLAAGLHADQRRLAVAVIPHKPGHINASSVAYDLPAIAAAADLVTLMAYEQHGPSTQPGPVAGLDWDTELLAGSLPSLTASRTLLGLGTYARRWTPDGAVADGYGPAVAAALAEPNARCDYDFAAQTPFIDSGTTSAQTVTYYDDADSLARKLSLEPSRGLAGIAIWRLGFEDPALWALLPATAHRS